jgi:hypothetical protein
MKIKRQVNRIQVTPYRIAKQPVYTGVKPSVGVTTKNPGAATSNRTSGKY